VQLRVDNRFGHQPARGIQIQSCARWQLFANFGNFSLVNGYIYRFCTAAQ
jgi:hypothetical protein